MAVVLTLKLNYIIIIHKLKINSKAVFNKL